MRHGTFGVMVLASWLGLFGLVTPSHAQHWLFGSRDDPAEQAHMSRWDGYAEATTAAGFSLIGPQWRGVTRVDLTARGENVSLGLDGSLRAGIYGPYDAETDEWRDIVRILDYARYQPDEGTYIRLGPLDRTRLGNGHLVNFLSTETVWDERTAGIEIQRSGQHVTLEAFTTDVTRRALSGARLSFSPFERGRAGWSSLQVAGAVVQDEQARTDTDEPFRGFESDVRLVAYRSGSFDFVPFVSGAWLPDYGQGVLIGANLENGNFIDMARLYLSLALHYNSSDFRHALFGAFYPVSGPGRSITSGIDPTRRDIALREVQRGNSILFESRVLFFERFELWYAFQRYHGVQRLSEYHLRLLFLARNVRISVAQDRRGLKGFASLFGDLGEENRMRFQFDLRLLGRVWLLMDAHYTYRPATESADGAFYTIQRRFDPVIGVRARF